MFYIAPRAKFLNLETPDSTRAIPEMEERRRRPRIFCESSVAIKLLSVPAAEEVPRLRTQGLTSDISACGMRLVLVTEEIIPVGSVLKLWVRLPGRLRRFVHIGIVRWVGRPPLSPAFSIGVDLTDSAKPVMAAWEKAVARIGTTGGDS